MFICGGGGIKYIAGNIGVRYLFLTLTQLPLVLHFGRIRIVYVLVCVLATAAAGVGTAALSGRSEEIEDEELQDFQETSTESIYASSRGGGRGSQLRSVLSVRMLTLALNAKWTLRMAQGIIRNSPPSSAH